MNNNGVSEIIGTILLLLIATAMFIPLELIVNNHFVTATSDFERYPLAHILHKNGVLYHIGGQPISDAQHLRVFYNNTTYDIVFNDLTGDDVGDGVFSFGEKAKVKI